ncbi:MAG: aspartate-semialdehyde dehydrogenase [Planctomycetota bacterium]|nr:MAG: aspartate-semialdehyde dehydrogenase [Planctomycetota bacterium]
MLVPLAPLHRAACIKRIVVSTYQSVSGAGAKAIYQLWKETQTSLRRLGPFTRHRRWSSDRTIVSFLESRLSSLPWRQRFSVLPKQIAFNVIPQVDVFLENRYTKEEMKMVQETRKILEEPQLPISATCVRVPVFIAHSEAVWIETERPLSVEQARSLLQRAPGVKVVDELPTGRERIHTSGAYPLPVDAAGQDDVLVGRLRKDDTVPHGLVLWVSGDNLRKGAATNAVQIAELLVKGKR